MTAFAAAAGGAALTWIPPAVTCSANGCAHSGWLSGPVSADVHHWLVGSAVPASPGPAWTGALVGTIPAGGTAAIPPRPPVRGASIALLAAPSVTVPAFPGRPPRTHAASNSGTARKTAAFRALIRPG